MNVAELHDALATLIKEGEADLEVVFDDGQDDWPIFVVSVDSRNDDNHTYGVVVLEDGDWSGG